jgi:hypothetical protein
MSNSQNWKAQSIPSFDGKKTELRVSGEVKSGIRPPILTKRESEGKPSKNFLLDLSGVGGGNFTEVKYTEDITGSEYEKVIVYNEQNEKEAEIDIEEVQSLKK